MYVRVCPSGKNHKTSFEMQDMLGYGGGDGGVVFEAPLLSKRGFSDMMQFHHSDSGGLDLLWEHPTPGVVVDDSSEDGSPWLKRRSTAQESVSGIVFSFFFPIAVGGPFSLSETP